MSVTENFSGRIRQGQDAVTGATEARIRQTKTLFSLVPTPENGLLNPNEAFEQFVRMTRRLTEVNAEYVQKLSGAVLQHVTGLFDVFQDEVLTTAQLANNQADKLEEAAIDQAREIERAERAEVRRAKKAERDAAAQKYEHMTKVELSDELGKRDLVKTGNVDELRDRLIDDDLRATS
jgi:hypothetical protein